jgi:hypothetical protein
MNGEMYNVMAFKAKGFNFDDTKPEEGRERERRKWRGELY